MFSRLAKKLNITDLLQYLNLPYVLCLFSCAIWSIILNLKPADHFQYNSQETNENLKSYM